MLFRKNPHLNSLPLIRFLSSVLILLLAIFGWYWNLTPALAEPSSPPPIPNPHVTLTVPPSALVGEDFTFFVTFDNSTPTTNTVGFAPFIDLVLDSGGADHNNPPPASGGPCDGIRLVKAEMVDVNGGPLNLTPPPNIAPCNTSPTALPHTFGGSPFGPVTVPAGAELRTIILPFGSYQQNQPPIKIKVTANVHLFADVNYPLSIYARAGFRYGKDALDNPGSDPPFLTDTNLNATGWAEQKTITPNVITLSKAYSGPENETATGPNFPRQYKITLNIADQQQITNLKVQDFLPKNMQYQGLVAVTPGTQGTSCSPGVGYVVTQQPPTNAPQVSPNNKLEVSFCPITGTTAPDDVTITFAFFIPRNNAPVTPVTPVLPLNCAPAISINDVKAEGDWTPQDPRDLPSIHVISDTTLQDHTLADKCIAVQKSVAIVNDTGASGPTPGDTLKYTLDFQISDYKTVGNMVIRDVLSDGQQLLLAPAPSLKVADKFAPGGLTGNFTPGTLLTQLNQAAACSPVTGGTVITFRVSTRMSTLPLAPPRYVSGILTGGWATTPTSNVPATGQIIFYVLIRDRFFFPRSTGDIYVDKDDPLTNCVDTFNGRVYTNVNPPTMPTITGVTAKDDSKTATAIVTDTIKKTVYAVRRGTTFICGPSGPSCSNSPTSPQEVRPGDRVTFRIEKTIPSSDAEKLTVEDWLPLPVFDVRDPEANGVLGPPWTFANSVCGIPVPGHSCILSSNTLPVSPALTQSNPTNSIKFNYGTFFATNNQPRKIDLVFTATVTNRPFADGLFLTNEAQECENNTFGVRFCQTAIAQVKLREPHLQIMKGVVATDNPNGVFKPSLTPSGKWKPFGTSCPAFNPLINSANLGGLINSDLSNVDANDWVTFAIAIENTGGAPAYDIELSDIIPLDALDKPSCFEPDFTGLCVHGGNGTSIPFTTAPGGHGRTIIKLATPLAPGSPSNPTGTNIAIITFSARLIPNIMPGCCDNLARLDNYASQPNGPDFVDAGFTPPFEDRARICVNPTLDKSIVATSEAHTTPQTSATPQTPANTPPAAIGEIVRYRLSVRLPEGGVLTNFQVTDALPPGMKFLPGSARLAFVSTNGVGITQTPSFGAAFNVSGNQSTLSTLVLTPAQTVPSTNITGGAACGAPVTFNLGDIQNKENDADLEYIVVEFNALVCNLPVNQHGATQSNTFSVSVGGNQVATSNAINVTVVEPIIGVQKTIGSVNPAGLTPFTITLTNTGATAFNVHMEDPLPTGLTLWGGSPAPVVSLSPAGCVTPTPTAGLDLTGNTLALDVPLMPQNCSVTVTFLVRVGSNCFTNTAKVYYSSLPGTLLNPPVGTQSNSTGSVTPCASSTGNDCERLYTASGQASVTTGCTGACAPPPPNMVSWWPLNETSGNTVADIKGGYGGITSANIGSDPNSAPSPKVVNALYFTNSRATVPGSPYNFGTGNFSIDAWIRGGQLTNAVMGIVDKLDTTSSVPTGFSFFVFNGRVQLIMGNGTASPATFMSTPTFTYNTWQHVAVTVQRVGAGSPIGRFYINGAPAGTFVPSPNSVNHNEDLLIGSHRLNPQCQSCEVALDEVEIFSDVVSANDINAIFTAGSAGKCTPVCASPPPNMVSWWPLDEPGGTIVRTDIKGAHNGTTLAGGVIYTQPGRVGGAHFIGNNESVSVTDHPALRFGTSNLSIDAWVRPGAPQFVVGIVDKLDIAAKNGYALYIQDRFLRFVMGNGSSFTTYTSTAQVVYGGFSWRHVAVTVNRLNPNGGTFYIDGIPAGSFTPLASNVNISNNSALLIGGSRLTFPPPNCVCEYMLDEVEIFKDVVSASAVNAIFTAGSVGKCRSGLAKR